MYLGCGKHKINIGFKELILNEDEILEIVTYYNDYTLDEDENILYSSPETHMQLFKQYYKNGRNKKSVFREIADMFGINWKTVEKSYYKYRHEYEI